MELQNLSYLVHGYENAIKELTEKKNNIVFDYCKDRGFEDGKRYIYNNPESSNNVFITIEQPKLIRNIRV